MNPLVLACTVALAQEVPKPVAEIIDALRAIESATGPCRTIVDVGILPENVGIDGPWPPATLERAECQEWLWSGPKVRVRRFAPESEVLAIDSVENLRDLRIWSGSEWIVRNANKRSCVLSTAPQLLPDDDCLAIFNGLAWPSFAGRQGLAESSARGTILAHESRAGTDSLALSQNPDGTMILTLLLDRERRAVSEIELRIIAREGQPNAGKPNAIIHYKVIEWRRWKDRDVPWRAVREATLFREERMASNGGRPSTQRIVMSRRIIEDIEPTALSDATFARPTLVAGDSVADKALRIAYTIGDDYVNVDGRIHKIAEKVNTYLSPDDVKRLLQDPRTRVLEP